MPLQTNTLALLWRQRYCSQGFLSQQSHNPAAFKVTLSTSVLAAEVVVPRAALRFARACWSTVNLMASAAALVLR